METSLVARLAAGLPERIARRIQLLLASVPDPETVTRYLERLLVESPAAFDRITSSAAALRVAVNVFSMVGPNSALILNGSSTFHNSGVPKEGRLELT